MSGVWAVQLPLSALPALAALRGNAGLMVGEADGAIWLRGDSSDDDLIRALRRLPGAQRFFLDDQRRLTPVGRQVPSARLPEVAWLPLLNWMTIAAPPAGFGLRAVPPVRLRAVRDTQPRETNGLLAAWDDWQRFAQTAARVRLQPLRFARSAEPMALVRGLPLPPLPGVRFIIEQRGIAVQAGWRWEPALDSAVVRECLHLDDEDLAVLRADGRWEIVPGDSFIHATRAAVRMSSERTA